jgi:hypothetical protein
VELLERAFRSGVVQLGPRAPYGAAVRAGLAQAPAAEPDEWVWLLHDDVAPAPGALAALTEVAENAPRDVAVLGPKIREWPSLKRLLEVGVTLTGTGRRETGLERGEYDQGQHRLAGRPRRAHHGRRPGGDRLPRRGVATRPP